MSTTNREKDRKVVNTDYPLQLDIPFPVSAGLWVGSLAYNQRVRTEYVRGAEPRIFRSQGKPGTIDSRPDMDYFLYLIRLFPGGLHPMAFNYRKPGMWTDTGGDSCDVIRTFCTGAGSNALLRAGKAIAECR